MIRRLSIAATLALAVCGCGNQEAGSVKVDIDRDAGNGMILPGVTDSGATPANAEAASGVPKALSPKSRMNAPAQ